MLVVATFWLTNRTPDEFDNEPMMTRADKVGAWATVGAFAALLANASYAVKPSCRGTLRGMEENPYKAPDNAKELLERYAKGERHFPDTELSDADLSGVTLDGASFEKWSWFNSTNFEGASLRGTSFRECHVKCANFRRADLTGASFQLAGVEAADFKDAILVGASFEGASHYGCTLHDGDGFPNG